MVLEAWNMKESKSCYGLWLAQEPRADAGFEI